MKTEIEVGSAIRLGIGLYGIFTTAFVLWACVDQYMIHAAAGMAVMLVALLPFFWIRTYDLFCPWSFVLLAISSGCLMQSIFTSFNYPDARRINTMMLLGQEPEYFLYPMALYLMAIGLLAVGYFGLGKSRDQEAADGIRLERKYSSNNMFVIIGGCLVLSILATVFFVRATGGAKSGRISDKRTKIRTVDVKADKELQQYGWVKQVSKFASICFLIMYAYFLTRYQSLSFSQMVILGVAFLAAIALPFYASSRAQVLWVLIAALGLTYYHAPQRFYRQATLVALAGLALFLVMSFLRSRDLDDAVEQVSVAESIAVVFLNRNGPGISKTAHIINNIPERLDYQYGKTFAVWLIAPIPRELYPNKPLIHSGPIIGTRVYNTKVSGVPPGLIAELYWNFHIPGLILGMVFIGWLLRSLYGMFRNLDLDPAIITPIYLFSFIPVGYAVLGNSLGYATVMRFVDFLMISGVVYLCTVHIHSDRE